mgnify:FL=1
MTDQPILTAERLRELCHYDYETGVFWKLPATTARLNCAAMCRKLGCLNITSGYVVVGVNKEQFYAHRLAWLYMTGEWPKDQIDHKNGNRADNKFDNLRDATDGQNKQNRQRAQVDNKCGFLGVHWNKQANKWQSELKTAGKKMYLGQFSNPEYASDAYLKAKRLKHSYCTI